MSRRERVMLIVAVVLLGAIVFKYLIYDSKEAEHATLVVARDAAADELARDERIVARAEQARAEYERLRSYIATVEQKLPQQKEIPALLTSMERYTGKVGVVFQSIRPGPLTAVGAPSSSGQAQKPGAGAGQAGSAAQGSTTARQVPYSSMPVDLSIQGTFAQTVEYLRGLRNFPRLVIVDAIALTPQKFPQLGVTIRAEIYTTGTPSGQVGDAH